MKIPPLKNNFGSEIIERGRKYYKHGRVRSLVVDGDLVAAVVIGNRNYRVRVNLKTGDFKCTCPCDFNCKHVVAVLLALKERKPSMKKNEIDTILKDKSKEDLIDLVKKMLISEPRLKKIIKSTIQDLKERIENLEMSDEDDVDGFVEEIDQLYDEVDASGEKMKNSVSLFKKCLSFYSEYEDLEPLEDSMFNMLESISKEAKKLPKDERKLLLQELIDLTRDYDFFWDSIDDSGVKLNY